MAKDTFTITRKIQLVPVGDKTEVNRVYNYIREGMKAQNLAMESYHCRHIKTQILCWFM